MARALRPVPVDESVIAVPFSTRISVESRRTIERAAFETGLSIRQLVEEAIAQRWGAGGHELPRAVGE